MLIKIEFSNNNNYFETEVGRFYFHFTITFYYECVHILESTLNYIYIKYNNEYLYKNFQNINKLNLKYY
jgi:hypothetical protein